MAGVPDEEDEEELEAHEDAAEEGQPISQGGAALARDDINLLQWPTKQIESQEKRR